MEEGGALPSRYLEFGRELADYGVDLAIEVATVVLLPEERDVSAADAAALLAAGVPAWARRRPRRQLRLANRLEAAPQRLLDGWLPTATHLWAGSTVVIDEVLDRHRAALAGGTRVLELGSGLGLPGMVCAALGARTVLTDVPEVCELLQQNAVANALCEEPGALAGQPRAKGRARIVPLRWDLAAARQLAKEEGGFDIVLCCDCVFEPLYGLSWMALAQCIEAVCGPRTMGYVSVQRRSEKDGVDAFLAHLSRSLSLVRLPTPAAEAAGRIEVFELWRPKPGELPGLQQEDGC